MNIRTVVTVNQYKKTSMQRLVQPCKNNNNNKVNAHLNRFLLSASPNMSLQELLLLITPVGPLVVGKMSPSSLLSSSVLSSEFESVSCSSPTMKLTAFWSSPFCTTSTPPSILGPVKLLCSPGWEPPVKVSTQNRINANYTSVTVLTYTQH